MSSEWPAVTAIICTHHRPQCLARALDSVYVQTWKDMEVIVIHDGPPSDDTKEVCKHWAEQFETANISFSFMSTDEKSGYYCAPRNMAILHARGDYIAHLDDDNVWTPSALESLVWAMEEGLVWPDFAYGRINYVLEEGASGEHDGKPLPVGLGDVQEWDAELGQESVALQRLATSPLNNFIDTSSFIAAKGAYWRLHLATGKMFNEEYRRFGDWELITRAVFFAGWRGRAVGDVVLDYYWGTKNQIQLNRGLEGVEAKALKNV